MEALDTDHFGQGDVLGGHEGRKRLDGSRDGVILISTIEERLEIATTDRSGLSEQ
jgi:hypothetical protein